MNYNVPIGFRRYTHNANSVWVSGSQQVTTNNLYDRSIVLTRRKTGVSNPNWRAAVRSFTSAGTPFSGVYQDLSENDSNITFYWNSLDIPGKVNSNSTKGRLAWPDFHLGISSAYVNQTISEANSMALTQAHNAVRNFQTSFSGGIFLGELRETLRMIKSPLQGVRNALKGYHNDLMKGRNYPRHQRYQHAANAWLEWSFGMKPLIEDTRDAIDAYEKLFDDIDRDVRDAYGSSERYVPSGSMQIFETGGFKPIIHTKKLTVSTTVRYKIGLQRQPYSSGNFQRRFGFGFEDFVPTLWELIPWSFFIDYFANVGDILNAFCTDQSGIRWVNKTERTRIEAVFDGRLDLAAAKTFGTFNNYIGGISRAVLSETRITRSNDVSLGVPDLILRFPGSPTKLTNTLSLGILFSNPLLYYKGAH